VTTGVVFYRGPSVLTGDPIVGIASGISGESMNPKTGPMVQTYVLRSDIGPMDAVRSGSDDAICGDCALRGTGGRDRKCYVTPFFGPLQIWKHFTAGDYPDVTWRELQAVVEGRAVRLCAYGDPAALPFEVWASLLETASTWTGYTHAYRRCDQRFKKFCMASVDTVEEFYEARALGWRTFRIRRTSNDPLVTGSYPAPEVGQSRSVPLEFVCPASDEADHRSTCQACQLCRGTSSPARNVVIVAHGKPSSLKAFGIDVPFFRRSDGQPIVKVCQGCGDDFSPGSPAQRLCQSCATIDKQPRRPCAGGCGRLIIRERCPDCILARQQARGRERLDRRRDEALA
jgi:hypothetical protein